MIDTPVRASSDESVPVVARRPLRSRFAAAHLVMVLAALVAFTLVLVALRDRSRHAFVAVAAVDLEQGSRVGAGDVELRRVAAEAVDALGDLLDAPEMQDALDEGAVVMRSLVAGTTLRVDDLRRTRAELPSERVMSIEIDAAHAAGGALVIGDAVDIVAPGGDEGAELIAAGVEVVAVRSGGGGLGSSTLVLSLAVDPPTALRLAAAVASDDVFVLRATGAAPFVRRGG